MEQSVTQREPMSYGDAERRMGAISNVIRKAEQDYDKAVEDHADAEALYRRKLGERFGELRKEGMPVEAAMTQARGELWTLSRERDISLGRVRKCLEALDNRRGDRASLHKLVDWSGGVDVMERRGRSGLNARTPYGSDNGE